MPIQFKIAPLALSFLFAQASFATSMPEQIQVPFCLAKKITLPHQVLAENPQFKIISIDGEHLNELSHLADEVQCGRFINLSQYFAKSSVEQQKQVAAQLLAKKQMLRLRARNNYEIKHQEEVNAALKEVNADNIWQTLTHLTSYPNRSATQRTGVEAAKWLKASFEEMATKYGRTDTSSYFVNTGYYQQPSVVTVIGKGLKGPGIVIGAHSDTLDGRMPGAGDDGSGSSSLMEMARVLLASSVSLKRPVYIIWYAAEERGLVGSQYVVSHFRNQGIPVKAVMQLDMTGYRVNAEDPTMWVYTDYTDRSLNNYVAQLIEHYVKVSVNYSSCGYGCSDHASWSQVGVPAAFPCESDFKQHNPYIHSESDVMEFLNLEHMTNFSKLAVAFAIELASE